MLPRSLAAIVPAVFALASFADEAQFAPAPGSPIQLDGSPGSAIAGDVNEDGAIDLVVTNLKLGKAQILLGDNTGHFRVSEQSIPNVSGVIAFLDANEDHHLDIAAVENGGYGVEVFLGDGKGSFTRAPGSPFPTRKGNRSHPRGFAAADLNEDGHADVLMANNFDGDASGAFGDGKGKFTALPKAIVTGEAPFNLVLADVNGDKHIDICTPTSEGSAGQVSILLGDGKGGFTPGAPFVGAPDPNWVALGDVNGDGKIDIVTNQSKMPLIAVGLGDGRGRFTVAPGSPFPVIGAPYASEVELGDANGDGRMDLFVATGQNIQVYLANEKGEMKPAPGSPYAAGSGHWRLVLGDWNKDGKCDVASSDFEHGTISILLAR